jgi:uncharacterized lipoprotein YmbA
MAESWPPCHVQQYNLRPRVAVTITACLLAVGGCSLTRKPPPTRLYVLTALPQAERVAHTVLTNNDTIGVGPVTLPQYTNRSQIVTGNTNPELDRASFEQWAEPLEGNFTRILAENLSLLLATDQVMVFPWQGPTDVAYHVIIDVTQFLGELGGQASLEARWSVLGKNGKEVLMRKKSSFTEPVAAQDYQALATALSRTVVHLSRDIPAAITALEQKGPRL